MSLVESEITRNNIELARNNPEFQKRNEREQTLVANSPDFLDAFKDKTVPHESTYLSHPDEEFSLRVRAKYSVDGITYVGTLKDEGYMDGIAKNRLEINAPISKETYELYQQQAQFPDVKFLRAQPLTGLSIDYIEGKQLPQVEYESKNGEAEPAFIGALKTGLTDMSASSAVRKETIAHELYAQKYGSETLKPSGETIEAFAERIMKDMVATYTIGHNQVVVGISGMSGSGKSTAVKALSEQITQRFGDEWTPIILSSDDYHRGKKWLEHTHGAPWTNWDDPRVYNTAELADDLMRLKEGSSIAKKHFDFTTEEVVYDAEITPKPFVIVEGLFAGSTDLKEVRQLHYEIPTGIATSIGRDVRRLVLENRANGSIGTPEDRLRYQLEVALPTYLAQERPTRNFFSESSRPLAQRAFMLDALRQPIQ